LPARGAPRLLLFARLEPHPASARTVARGAAGARGLPGHGIRGGSDRAAAARPHPSWRPRHLLRGELSPHALSHPSGPRPLRRALGWFGETHTLLSPQDWEGVWPTLAERATRLVIFESPTNPVTKIADIAALTRLARAAGALSMLDNTFAGFHQHGEYEVDFYLHSLTKYASGTGDVMGGAVIGRGDLIRGLRNDFGALGGMLDPHAA